MNKDDFEIDGIKIKEGDKVLFKPNTKKWWQFWKKKTFIYVVNKIYK